MRKLSLFLLPTIMLLAACSEPTTVTTTETTTHTTTQTQHETITKITTAQPLQPADNTQQSNITYSTEPQENTNSMLADLTLIDVRVGTHEHIDRVVFEFQGRGKPGWHTRYVGQAFHMASGLPMDVVSDNNLEVMIHGTPMGNPWPDSLMKTGLMGKAAGNIQNITNGGAFEGDSQFFINLDKKRPYTVYTLENPTRLVVDFEK